MSSEPCQANKLKEPRAVLADTPPFVEVPPTKRVADDVPFVTVILPDVAIAPVAKADVVTTPETGSIEIVALFALI